MHLASLVFLIALGASSSLLTPAHARGFSPGWIKSETAGVSYWMYRPDSLKDGGPSSLMLNLHGCKQTADVLKNLANWEGAAEKHKMTVVIPFVPNGGVVLGCWDYYGRDHTEENKYNKPLIDLTLDLIRDSDLAVDRDRVFVSGLSSGASQAMVLGCLRPDLFRGIGFAAGPVVGSELSEVSRPKISADEAARVCAELAGARIGEFNRQRFSIIFDSYDPAVNASHAETTLKAVTQLYGGNMREIPLDLSRCQGPNKRGWGTLYRDSADQPRISYIQNSGLGHAWPAGSGRPLNLWPQSTYLPSFSKRTFVNPDSLNYPMILSHFLDR